MVLSVCFILYHHTHIFKLYCINISHLYYIFHPYSIPISHLYLICHLYYITITPVLFLPAVLHRLITPVLCSSYITLVLYIAAVFHHHTTPVFYLPAVQVTGTEYVERGNPIQLICNATGKPDPPHNVDWFKDGTRLESDAEKGIIITKKIETKVRFIERGGDRRR